MNSFKVLAHVIALWSRFQRKGAATEKLRSAPNIVFDRGTTRRFEQGNLERRSMKCYLFVYLLYCCNHLFRVGHLASLLNLSAHWELIGYIVLLGIWVQKMSYTFHNRRQTFHVGRCSAVSQCTGLNQ